MNWKCARALQTTSKFPFNFHKNLKLFPLSIELESFCESRAAKNSEYYYQLPNRNLRRRLIYLFLFLLGMWLHCKQTNANITQQVARRWIRLFHSFFLIPIPFLFSLIDFVASHWLFLPSSIWASYFAVLWISQDDWTGKLAN